MTEPKLKADKEAGLLSETAKTRIREKWLFNKYGYRELVETDEMLKGKLCEADSMLLTYEVLGGEPRIPFKQKIANDFIKGIPDIVLKRESCVEDNKTSFTIKTFMDAELSKLYEYQLRGYMWLLGCEKARLIYCLINTPDEILIKMKQRIFYKFDQDNENPEYIKQIEQIDRNHKYDDIPKIDKVKVFEITRDLAIEEKIKQQVIKCRNYYNTLKL